MTHAGTALASDGKIVTAGGRVLNVTGLGADAKSARQSAYAAAGMISFQGMQLRRDIAARADDSAAPPGGSDSLASWFEQARAAGERRVGAGLELGRDG